MPRRESREQAFLLIFEKSFGSESVEELLEAAGEARDVHLSAFARELLDGVTRELPQIDAVIAQHTKNWSTDRLSRVALSVLRLAVYEMRCGSDQPEAVAINEAVELAKTYGGAEDAAFINGVLGGISRAEQGETV